MESAKACEEPKFYEEVVNMGVTNKVEEEEKQARLERRWNTLQ